ncbi:putative membrane protein [Streptococcus uberis 0140J]|uniref:Membrane protein n=1 Tax=Streptococcus uberis (strain ATCC BAA-854 / 0140J) TaxID=218495 RepID=B9DTY0_STRU0|nr:membrane protein [Streptococcus uberis 6736]KKF61991.1 membrane protein [Streptococcus uberis C6344]QWX09802.1 hypothetical protein MDIKOOEB_00010 [Streptococcus uberis]CAR41234.1 putative membrane protein [Streptococcus uberis 0140J]SQG45885.1 membrane protein [Streptococcus uberis]
MKIEKDKYIVFNMFLLLKGLLPLSLTTILIIVFGNVLKIDSWKYTKLILSAVTFELVCFLLSRPKDKHYLSLKATIQKFSTFIRQTKYFSSKFSNINILTKNT